MLADSAINFDSIQRLINLLALLAFGYQCQIHSQFGDLMLKKPSPRQGLLLLDVMTPIQPW